MPPAYGTSPFVQPVLGEEQSSSAIGEFVRLSSPRHKYGLTGIATRRTAFEIIQKLVPYVVSLADFARPFAIRCLVGHVFEAGTRRQNRDLFYPCLKLIGVTFDKAQLGKHPEVFGKIFIWVKLIRVDFTWPVDPIHCRLPPIAGIPQNPCNAVVAVGTWTRDPITSASKGGERIL